MFNRYTVLCFGLGIITCWGRAGALERKASDGFAAQVTVGVTHPVTLNTQDLPPMLVADQNLGLIRHRALHGQVVHIAAKGLRGLFETRAVRTPKGDLLLIFPEGDHYAAASGKVNRMLAYRSHNNGNSWTGPTVAFDIDFSQHGFIPLIPRGTDRIYAFGTQPIPSEYSRARGKHENAPIGYRWSDDDGHTWSDVRLIRPENDPTFLGMSVMRMCETENGTWLLGSHEADWSKSPLQTRQYILRSEDRGNTWSVLPGPRPSGWFAPNFHRMDEGRPIHLGGGEVLFMARTPTGRLWTARSKDHGKTWTNPAPSQLVHPDAPPMLYQLSDRKTLIAFHHNRHLDTQYQGLRGNMDGMRDRSEIWLALSKDGGRTWSEPQFLFVNALGKDPAKSGWFNHNASYLDAVIDNGQIHLFCPHRWNRAVYLMLPESDLDQLPTRDQLIESSSQ